MVSKDGSERLRKYKCLALGLEARTLVQPEGMVALTVETNHMAESKQEVLISTDIISHIANSHVFLYYYHRDSLLQHSSKYIVADSQEKSATTILQ